MSMLIIGGLLALAVMAILGAVLLGLTEERATRAEQIGTSPTRILPPLPENETPSWQVTSPLPASNAVPPTPVLKNPSEHLIVFDEDEDFSAAHAQEREFTGELRALTQKAGELERRLSNLSELFERQRLRPATETYTSVPGSQAQAVH